MPQLSPYPDAQLLRTRKNQTQVNLERLDWQDFLGLVKYSSHAGTQAPYLYFQTTPFSSNQTVPKTLRVEQLLILCPYRSCMIWTSLDHKNPKLMLLQMNLYNLHFQDEENYPANELVFLRIP